MKKKISKALLLIILSISIMGNILQKVKYDNLVKNAKYEFNKNFIGFSSYDISSFKDENLDVEIYTESLSKFSQALALSHVINERDSYTDEEYYESLPFLMGEIHRTFMEDRKKIVDVFSDTSTKYLIHRISTDINDRESIKKLMNLLNE